ncbi:MAG: hypothetical protein methR_P0609 [Methyloprofundus sp.]|nr:MAG: hypothetical protein methR_P0609 [Methyloprofundus sp.]
MKLLPTINLIQRYQQNAFRITGLSITASSRAIRRWENERKIKIKTGVKIEPDHSAWAVTVDEDTCLAALQRLNDPIERWIEEFFWFLPKDRESKQPDSAEQAFSKGDLNEALSIWESEQDESYALHNLAVAHQILSLENTQDKENEDWKLSYRYWLKLLKREDFWNEQKTYLYADKDQRLKPELAVKLQQQLPRIILGPDSHFAYQAAEQQQTKLAKKHLSYIKASGFEDKDQEHVLLHVLEPLDKHLKALCAAAEVESEQNPQQSDLTTRKLLEKSQSLVAISDLLLSKKPWHTQKLHDRVAERLHQCLITYGESTHDWVTCVELGKKILPLAASGTVRDKISENLETDKKANERNFGWYSQAYFNLPSAIQEQVEQAYDNAQKKRWDKALEQLSKIFKNPELNAIQKAALKKPFAFVFDGRSTQRYNELPNNNQQQPAIIEKILRVIEDHPEFWGEERCNACGEYFYEQYMTLTYNNTGLNVCIPCNKKAERVDEKREINRTEKLKLIGEDISLAYELGYEGAKKDLETFRDIAKDRHFELTDPRLLMFQYGLFSLSGISQLIKTLLEDKSTKIRLMAIEGLAQNGSEAARAVPVLAKLLADSNSKISGAATKALGHIGGEAKQAIPLLINYLGDIDTLVCKDTLTALVSIDPDWAKSTAVQQAIPALIECLTDDNTNSRKAAGKTLGQIDPQWVQSKAAKQAMPRLIDLLSNNSSAVCKVAASTLLAKIDPKWAKSEAAKHAVPALKKHLIASNSNSEARMVVAQVLGQIGEEAKPATAELIQCLTSKNKTSMVKAVIIALDKIVDNWSQQKVNSKQLSELVKYLGYEDIQEIVTKLLNEIDDTWRKTQSARQAVPFLTKRLNQKGTDKKRLTDILNDIDPFWRKKCKWRNFRVTVTAMILIACTIEGGLFYLNPPASIARFHLRYRLIDQKQAVSFLLQMLATAKTDASISSIEEVIEALDKINPQLKKQAIPLLITHLADKDYKVRIAASRGLGKIGIEAVPELIKNLTHSDANVRIAATNTLGYIGYKANIAVTPLIKLLTDSNSEVRKATASALGKIDPYWQNSAVANHAVPALTGRLSDGDPNIRVAAARAISQIGLNAGPITPELVLLLVDSNSEVRELTFSTLEKIDPLWGNSMAAINSAPALIERFSDSDPNIRGAAARAFDQIYVEPIQIVPELILLLTDNDGKVRKTANRVLDQIDPQWAASELAKLTVPGLIIRFTDESWTVRDSAARTLGQIDSNWRNHPDYKNRK